MSTREAIVDALTARLRPLEIEVAEAWWLASTEVSEEHDRRRVAAELARRDALADPHAFAEIRVGRRAAPGTGGGTGGPRPGGGAVPDLIGRQLDLLHDACLPHQVPADLRAEIVELEAGVESTFNAFRGTIDGERVDDNTILHILRRSDDAGLRRAAWEASKQVGAEVADRVRALARTRNRAARELGFRDHFQLALATSELDEARLLATLTDVASVTDAPFASWKEALDAELAQRFRCDPHDLRPWHYDDPFFQEPPVTGTVDLDRWFADADLEALTVRTYDGLGLDVRDVLARSDLLPRENKSQHAFCIDIDREGDVRVLCNNVPSERWAGTMLHELGHAAYDVEVSRDLPWLLRTMHPLTTEGVAMLFGRLVRDPAWLGAIVGVPPDALETLAPALRAARRAALLVFARWVLVMTNFERALYADPEADHDTRWWDLVERYQRVHPPDRRRAPDWAAKIHLAVAPVYYQNYLYGELVASQLQAALRRGPTPRGMLDTPAAGDHLRRLVFAPGASRRWDTLVEQATGEPLGARHLAGELA